LNPAELGREIGYPFRHLSVILAVPFFAVLLRISSAAGLIGLPLLLVLLPALLRYLVSLFEARAANRPPDAPSIETFSLWSDSWAMTPLIPLALIAWLQVLSMLNGWWWTAVLVGIAAVYLMPAIVAVLALTHSPVQSLNPASVVRLVRACGPGYALAPTLVLLVSPLLLGLPVLGLPRLLSEIAALYLVVALLTMTAALVHREGLAAQVELPAPRPDPPEARDRRRIRDRQTVASHAYGLASRGNRAGGIAHIRRELEDEPDIAEAALWYFTEMMRWESRDAALEFGRTCLALLLQAGDEAKSLKLLSSCLFAEPRWKPAPDERDSVIDLVRRHGRADLERLLTR